jgi:branched-chain amino acid aminotransferase
MALRQRDRVPFVPEMSPARRLSAPPNRQIWLDGALVPWERATVHVLSHSLQRGSLVFDYMKVYLTSRGSAVFRMQDHIDRLLDSAKLVGLPLGLGSEALSEGILRTVAANPGATAVKVSAYIPSVEIDVVPEDDRVSVAIAAYDPEVDLAGREPEAKRETPGLRLWIEKGRRRRHDILDPKAKAAANYVSPMAAKWEARRRGYDDVLFIDEEGCVAEGPTTNVFFFDANGTLKTPSERHVLLGVTRRSIIDLAKHQGLEVHEEAVAPEALLDASEAFLTGSTAGVSPVVEIDDRVIGGGEIGPQTAALRERFRKITRGGDPDFDHWLNYVEGS